MVVLNVMMLFVWGVVLILLVLGTVRTLGRVATPPTHLDAPFGLFPISILKPLKGVDYELSENLESFFQLDYPNYELLFSVETKTDLAVPIVESFIQKYPLIKAALVIGHVESGPNPKVNNLIRSYRMAENDWILISDSNVRVAPDYLKKLFAHVENGVGMVTSVVAGVDAQDLGSNLESIYLNTFYARGMNIASLFNRVPVVGKSMLFRRTVADRFGGIETLSRYLAEDFMAGEAIKMLGLKIVLASDPIRQHLGRIRVSEFWNRHIRWGRIRKAQAPFVFLLEPISSLFVSGVIGALGCYGLFGVNIGWFLLAHIVVWAVCDHLLIVSIGRTISVFTLFAWLLREILYLPLWLAIAAGNKVHWRGQTLTIDADGLVYCSK